MSRFIREKSTFVPGKLTEKQVLSIRKRVKEGERQCDIAKELKLSIATIYKIISRRTWKNI